MGWLSLCLIEIGMWHATGMPPVYYVLLWTLLIYCLVGIISGLIFGLIAPLLQRILRFLKEPVSHTGLSMSACISAIIFLYGLSLFLQAKSHISTSLLVFKSTLFFLPALVSFCVLPFFFRWSEKRRSLVTTYLSLLPALWIFTSLKLNAWKDLFPTFLQVTTPLRTIILLFTSVFCIFVMYFSLSLIKRSFRSRKSVFFFMTILSILFLCILFIFLKKDGSEQQKKKAQGTLKTHNILLVTLDTVRADHLSCYGYQRLTTPNLDRFSREGVVFKNVVSPSSWTLPSHASMFTGMYPTRHGADHKADSLPDAKGTESKESGWKQIMFHNFTRLSDEHQTLAEIFSDRGYRTAGIIGGVFCSSIFGLAQGFDYYDDEIPFFNIHFFLVYELVDHFFSLNDFFSQYGYLGKRIAADLNNSAFTWLEKNHDQPFFLFINYMDAHTPYLPPPPYDGYFSKMPKNSILHNNPPPDSSFVTAQTSLINSVISGSHQLTPEEKELTVSLYDGGILYLDHYLGLLFEKLKKLKIYDDTLIIITSDHGEAFGEHNQMEHGHTLYEEVLRVPLIIKYPSAYPVHGEVEKRTSLVDLMPTILSLLRYPIPSGIDGEIMDKSDHQVIAELFLGVSKKDHKGTSDLRALYEGKEKYIWASQGSGELYNLEKDPQEETNLITKFPQKAQSMDMALKQWLASVKLSRTEKANVKITKPMEEKLKALGYLK
jgi:arylsulfatase A-like enzyme